MKNKKSMMDVTATIINKKTSDYYPIPGKIPTPTDLNEVTFQFENGTQKSFEVSIFEYNVLEIGDCGELIYRGNEIVSFADKIKDFSL